MTELNFRYTFMGNSIFVYFKDERFVINKGDLRFEKINHLIKSKSNNVDIENILNFKKVLPSQIYEKDNYFFIKDIKISDELLIPLKGDLEAFQNFYLNLENSNHFDKDKTWYIYKQLKKINSFSSNGFAFIIDPKNVKKNEDKDTPYDIKDLSDTPFYYLKDNNIKKELSKGIEHLLLKNFGESTKKLKRLVNNSLFSDYSEVNPSIVYLLKASKNVLSASELVNLLENSNIDDWFDSKSIAGFKSFINFYFKSSQRKMRFLTEDIDSRLFFCFDKAKDNMKEFEKFKTNEEIFEKIMNFYYLHHVDSEESEILRLYPVLKNISGQTVAKNYKIDYPKNADDFKLWKETMNNCLQTRTFNFFKGEKLILGLRDKEDELRFVLEINSNNTIGDFEGRNKVKVPADISKSIREILKKHSIIV